MKTENLLSLTHPLIQLIGERLLKISNQPYETASFAIRIGPIICLPSMNALWLRDTVDEITFLRRSDRTLASTLLMEFERLIGLNSLMCKAATFSEDK